MADQTQQQYFQLQPVPPNKNTPARDTTEFLHRYTAGALLQFVQSFITGVLTFVTVYAIALIVFNAIDPYKPALLLGVITLLGTWIMRQRLWITLATQALEHATGIDINNDGVIGAPVEDDPQVQRIRIELSKIGTNGHYSRSGFELPKGVTNEHLAGMAHDLFILGKSFAETELSGTGKISLPKFRQLRAVMERQGLCEKIGAASNAPFELTDIGEEWFRNYLPSPALAMEDQ